MDISLKVLNRYVKVDDQDPKELADKITSIGLEVEGMHDLTRGNNMTIGYVKELSLIHIYDRAAQLEYAQVLAKENGVEPGEQILITAGTPGVGGTTSYLELVTVK